MAILGKSLFVAAALLLAGTACSQQKSVPEAVSAPKTISDFFEIKLGDKTVRLQVALQPYELQQGLMYRKDLGKDEGMVFVFEKPQKMSFWMRNTPTPLDIGYFSADGVLQEVYPLYPYDESSVPSRSSTLQFAVEMNQGWYKANSIRAGAQLDRKALIEAIKARGLKPASWGL